MSTPTDEVSGLFEFDLPASGSPVRAADVANNFMALGQDNIGSNPNDPPFPREGMSRTLKPQSPGGNYQFQRYIMNAWRTILELTPSGSPVAGVPVQTVRLLATAGSIDGTAAGFTNVLTGPVGLKTVITQAFARITAASPNPTTGDITAGWGTAPGLFDIFPATPMLNLRAVGKRWVFAASGIMADLTPGGVAVFQISNPVAVAACTLEVGLVGFQYER